MCAAIPSRGKHSSRDEVYLNLPMIWFLFFVFLIGSAGAAGTSNNFIFPSNLTTLNASHVVEGSYEVGSTVDLRWDTIWDMVTIVIWQNGKPPYQYLPNSGNSTLFYFTFHLMVSNISKSRFHTVQIPNLVTSYTWIIDISGTNGNPGFDLNNGSTFYFIITHTGSPDLFASQSINITNKTISSSATSSHSSLTIETTSTASISPATSSPSSPATTSSELSPGAKVGIGVGVTLGITAIIAAFALGYHLRQPSRSPNPHTMTTKPDDEAAEPKPFVWQPPQELSSNVPRPKPQDPIFEIQG
ncbi:hypothetical protein BELL_0287g00060 [Botrytis elliptica]|uniref:Mid2 domain-containing protein n=1 Tax=Botrytis elliptica TaxID=278938 RepID=A0A4Z1JT49_9HELO|nr:hypothetical protein BELL_0287g00060 [Botrytis elliptica]